MLSRRRFGLSASAYASTFVLAACSRTDSHANTIDTTEPALSDATQTPQDPATAIDWANLSQNEWRERLSAEEFYVLRQEGTERPWSSPLNDEKRVGTYACRGCALPLFTTEQKFDSGTGWPSFYDVIPGAVGTKRDFKLVLPRTEYHCSRCGGHQGHVFNDGPQPTGLRYCNNGVALQFITDA